MKELADVNSKLSQEIVGIVELGNELESSGDFDGALKKYAEAWGMLPEPKEAWDLSHWIAKTISSLCLKISDFKSAKKWSLVAVETKPPRETSSLIILGASYLGLGEDECAQNQLKKAFDMGGDRAFQGFDKQYLTFLKKVRGE
ncbi:MAG TPA: hypothetical protein VES70_22170 [Pseudomonas sp.]|nr:hypothetical protein [Pseudomonas sp.]